MKAVRFIVLCFSLFGSGILWAQDSLVPPQVTFKEYLTQVLSYYPSLKREHASIEKAIAHKALAASSQMPQFWASLKSEYGNDPVYVFGSLLRQNKFTSDDFALKHLNTPSSRSDNSAGIETEWLLFDFSQTAARIKSAGILSESIQFQAQLTHMEAILAASEVYSRLALTDVLLKTLEEQVSAGQEDIKALESLNQKGLALGADFYLARMTQTQLLQLKNETVAQRAALAMVFNVLRGADPSVPVMVTMDFDKSLTVSGNAQEWINKAVAHRLDIKAMEKTLEAGGIQVSAEKKSILPRVVAYGGVDEHVHKIGDSGGGNYMVGIKAKMEVFDPGYGARVKLAKEELNRLAAQYQETKDQAAKEEAETYYRLQALSLNVQLAKNSCDDAKRALKLLVPLYREGQRTAVDILSLRSNTIATMDRWLKLEASRRQSILALKFYAGELTSSEAEAIYGQ